VPVAAAAVRVPAAAAVGAVPVAVPGPSALSSAVGVGPDAVLPAQLHRPSPTAAPHTVATATVRYCGLRIVSDRNLNVSATVTYP